MHPRHFQGMLLSLACFGSRPCLLERGEAKCISQVGPTSRKMAIYRGRANCSEVYFPPAAAITSRMLKSPTRPMMVLSEALTTRA
jgi:hypothetical protein